MTEKCVNSIAEIRIQHGRRDSMGKVILYTGGIMEPKAIRAIERIEDTDRAEYLSVEEMRTEAMRYIIFLECSDRGEWHIHRYYDPLIDDIDVRFCRYFIFDSISDYVRRFISLDNYRMTEIYYTRIIMENLEKLLDTVRDNEAHMIILSDDAFDIKAEDRKGNMTRSVLFEVNRQITRRVDEVIFIEGGRQRR